MKNILHNLRLLAVLTILTGIIYPLVVTGISQCLFPFRANGSIITKDHQPTGSLLIGQSFDTDTTLFHSRPSGTGYQTLPSGGTNLGPASKVLKTEFDQRKTRFIFENHLKKVNGIPAEMLFTSASGLDPHISPEAALLQVERVCKARNLSVKGRKALIRLIDHYTESSFFLFPGEKRVNVLLLNLETCKIK